MTDKLEQATPENRQADRAVWERPELKRITAQEAQATGGGSTDLGVLS